MREIEPKIIGTTFDDFMLRPQHAKGRRSDITNLKTKLTKKIWLNLPIVSANMDTVTEHQTAICLARNGGLGFIHRNMSIGRQAREVEKVKRADNFVIEKPYTIGEFSNIHEAKEIMDKNGVRSLVVVSKEGKLRGILTHRDIKFMDDHGKKSNLLVCMRMVSIESEKLIYHKGSVETPDEAMLLLDKYRVKKIPLVDEGMMVVGLITSKDIEKLMLHPYANKDANGRLRVAAAIGVKGDFLERARELKNSGVDVLLMDIAHGDSETMKKGIEQFRKKFDNFELIAGNIATGLGADFLKDMGVNGIKIGIGPGKGCETRLSTSAGVGQVEAIRSAYLAVSDDGIPLIADGGVNYNKDICIALAFGASSVMLGSKLGGTDESPGRIITKRVINEQGKAEERKFKIYRGMTSPEAKLANEDELSEGTARPTHIEGRQEEIPYQGGSVEEILVGIRESLQSFVSYAGEETLEEVRRKISLSPMNYYSRITLATQKESKFI
ncbi:MAG: IMP dehydrogenase [Candidatus Spechtbacteria bacterium]|nr:IMP dehydrogenase [Candidatus Spechtbacteria bacterium]